MQAIKKICTLLLYLALALHIPAARAAATVGGPHAGMPAPAFHLQDMQGHPCSLADFRGRTITLCFFCGCQPCHDFARAWGEIQTSDALPHDLPPKSAPKGKGKGTTAASPRPPLTLIVFFGDAQTAHEFDIQTGLDDEQTRILCDPMLSLARVYSAEPCPRLFVIDTHGVIRYTNNHADDAPLKASADLLVARVVDSLRACTAPPAKSTKSPKRPATSGRQPQGKNHA